MAIDTLTIRGVRGIRRDLTLALHGSSLVLRGDNGTGKSSIVAGLLWALRGESAPNEAARAGTEAAYRAHVLEGAAKAEVTVTLAGGGSVRVSAKEIDVNEAGLALRDRCVSASPFLLRKHLLRFLEDRPADRFRYLESFLELEDADAVRDAIEKRSRELDASAELQRRKSSEHLTSVTALLPRQLVPQELTWDTTVDALRSWCAECVQLRDSKPDDWNAIAELPQVLAPLISSEAMARKRVLLDDARDEWKHIPTAPPDPGTLLERHASLMAHATDAGLKDLLVAAAAHFSGHPEEASCPVCGQDIDQRVAEEIRNRLSGLQELRDLESQVGMLGSKWRSYWNAVVTAADRAAKARELDSMQQDVDVPELPHGVDGLTPQITPFAFASEVTRIGVSALTNWADTTRERSKRKVEVELEAQPSDEQADDSRTLVRAIERAKEVELAARLADSQAEEDSKRAARLRALSEALRTARQDIAKALLDEISTLVEEYYRQIHPPEADDEVTGAPAIEVQRHAGGTAHVRGRFHSEEVNDPRWVYSDGHLDTVGICVFFALRRFRADRDSATDPKLMILDDIVLSVDLTHGRRLLDLLREKFADHQVMIFTHNGLFFDWCIQRLPNYKRKAIARWTLESGPQLGDYTSALEHITSLLDKESSPRLLAQAAMNLMDEWLAEARFVYELTVPAKRGEEYTLTEIWEPFGKRMKEMERAVGTPIGQLTTLIKELGDLPRMRNRLAAHENEFAREYPLSVVRDAATKVVALVRTLRCFECGTFATAIPRPKEAEIIRCSTNCQRIRYHRPAKTPV